MRSVLWIIWVMSLLVATGCGGKSPLSKKKSGDSGGGDAPPLDCGTEACNTPAAATATATSTSTTPLPNRQKASGAKLPTLNLDGAKGFALVQKGASLALTQDPNEGGTLKILDENGALQDAWKEGGTTVRKVYRSPTKETFLLFNNAVRYEVPAEEAGLALADYPEYYDVDREEKLKHLDCAPVDEKLKQLVEWAKTDYPTFVGQQLDEYYACGHDLSTAFDGLLPADSLTPAQCEQRLQTMLAEAAARSDEEQYKWTRYDFFLQLIYPEWDACGIDIVAQLLPHVEAFLPPIAGAVVEKKCYLARADDDDGAMTCVDDSFNPLAMKNPVQFGTEGSVYYADGVSMLRQEAEGGNQDRIKPEVAGKMRLNDFVIREDSTIVISGSTESKSDLGLYQEMGWVRTIDAYNKMTTVIPGEAENLRIFPDGNAYFKRRHGLIKIVGDTYETYTEEQFDPVAPVALCEFNFQRHGGLVETPAGKLVGWCGKFWQVFPTVETWDVPDVDNVYQVAARGEEVFVYGLSTSGKPTLWKWTIGDAAVTEVDLGGECEIFTMSASSDGKLYISGLNVSEGELFVGTIDGEGKVSFESSEEKATEFSIF